MTTFLEKQKENFIKIFPEFEKFYIRRLKGLSNRTRANHLSAFIKLLNITEKINPKNFNENDIDKFIAHDDFERLSNKSKNQYLLSIKKLFQYFKRDDLIKIFPKKYREKEKELSKSALISRKELNEILKILNTKKRALIMVLYEGALRRSELVNIEFRDVVFQNGFIELYIRESKTKARNIPLIESIPYLQEYFNITEFKTDEKIFGYREQYITTLLNRIGKKLKENKNLKWNKDLHPHLLRHSRLTELALTKLNEPQLRKFAGWSKDSNMPKIYFHLDDTDIKNILVQENGQEIYKKPKPKTFKSIKCKVCDTENNQQNAFCYKCGNVINKEKVVLERVKEQVDIERLQQEIKELKERVKEWEEIVLKFIVR